MHFSRTTRSIVILGLTFVAFYVASVFGMERGDASKMALSLSDAAQRALEASTASDNGHRATEVVMVRSNAAPSNATVASVVDGDTIDVLIDGEGDARVRLLGVNTPETVDPRKPVECFGKEASSFSKSTLEGKRVRVVADPRADERDKYGRLLRNVFLEDGTDMNATLVASGFAYAYTSFPLDPERKRQLVRLQDEAKNGERGLWASDACGE